MTAHPKPKVCKDPDWLKVVRQMHCFFCRHRHPDTMGNGPSEASHLDTKSRDDRVLPMCGGCHRTSLWSWHNGQRTFCRYYGVSKAELIREAESLYRAYKEGQ